VDLVSHALNVDDQAIDLFVQETTTKVSNHFLVSRGAPVPRVAVAYAPDLATNDHL
jgi:hypothetical protein